MLFEEVLLRMLALEAETDGKRGPTTSERGGGDRFDAVLPDGVNELPGPLAVEIKMWLRAPTSRMLETLERVALAARRQDLAGVLLIVDAPLSDRTRAHLAAYAADLPIHVSVWDQERVDRLKARHANALPAMLREAALAPVRAALASDADWRPEAEALLDDLSTRYRENGVVMVLGAGVSIGSGLPNWDDLVASLFVSMVTKHLGGKIDEQQALVVARAAQGMGGDSPLLAARYLRRGIEESSGDDPSAFHRRLSEALYHELDEEFKASALLIELAKLCVPKRTGPKVHAVVTYNFDDLLETALRRESVAHCSVFSGREHAEVEELPIYHAHGFLPRDVDAFENLADGILAFSEEGYHQLFRDPYHWTNVVQLQAFQQQTCVFIGLSMTDPNLRRLLEYAALRDDEPRHYVFMKRSSTEDLMARSPEAEDGTKVLDENAASDYLRVHHSIQERVLRELGLKVVWFDDFGAMPRAINRLRAAPAPS